MRKDIFENINEKLTPEPDVITELFSKIENKKFVEEPVINDEIVPNGSFIQTEDETRNIELSGEKAKVKKKFTPFIAVAAAAVLILGAGTFLTLKYKPFGMFEDKSVAGAMTDDNSEQELWDANGNAKTVFCCVNNAACDMIADGREDELIDFINSGKYKVPVLASEFCKSDDNEITREIGRCLEAGAFEDGYIWFEFDQFNNVICAQWAESLDEGIVGQYPEPETDPEAVHKIGEMFHPDAYKYDNLDDSVWSGLVTSFYDDATSKGLSFEFETEKDLPEGRVFTIAPGYVIRTADGVDLKMKVGEDYYFPKFDQSVSKAGDKQVVDVDWSEPYGELESGDYNFGFYVIYRDDDPTGEVYEQQEFSFDFTVPDEIQTDIHPKFDDLKLTVVDASSDTLDLRLENTSADTDVSIRFDGTVKLFDGSYYKLYKYTDGEYEELVWHNNKTSTTVENSYDLNSGEYYEGSIQLTDHFDELTTGQYKIEYNFNVVSPDHKTIYSTEPVTAEFTVGDIDSVDRGTVKTTKDALGFSCEMKNVTSTGGTFVITSDGSYEGSELLVDEAFKIYRINDDGSETPLDYLNSEFTWNSIAYGVDTNKGGTTRIDIDWTNYYGELSAGKYLIEKAIVGSPRDTLIATFEIE